MNSLIEGVKTKQLKPIPDERGRLMELLRRDDSIFTGFGQTYMTTTYPGVVKAWHYHKVQVDNVAVVKGMLKMVIYDNRDGSPTKGEVNEFFVGEHNPLLVQIPCCLYHGWKCIGESEAIVVNCPTEPYDHENPDEYRLPFDSEEIPYDWDLKHG